MKREYHYQVDSNYSLARKSGFWLGIAASNLVATQDGDKEAFSPDYINIRIYAPSACRSQGP
eukprot:6127941-Pleurochrysis_carterae.AAC.5